MRKSRILLLGGVLLVLFAGANARDADPAGWGSIKGQVIFAGDVPERKAINVTMDQKHCLMNGPLLEEVYVVDKKTKGVRWVMAWLADAKQPKNAKAIIPIHPDLVGLKDKTITIDQPCCAFEPHVFGVIAGQTVTAKNSSPVPHNVRIDGTGANPMLNQLLPPGAKLDVPGWSPTTVGAIPISCSIHPWMRSYVRVFNHPYFAVTNDKGEFQIKNAPAGDFRLIIWQEEKGWLVGREGMPITIKDKGELDLGKIQLTP